METKKETSSGKSTYVIAENPKKDEKKNRKHSLCMIIGGVRKYTGEKVELTDLELKRYGKENFKKT